MLYREFADIVHRQQRKAQDKRKFLRNTYPDNYANVNVFRIFPEVCGNAI